MNDRPPGVVDVLGEPRKNVVYDGFEPSGRPHIAQVFGPVLRERWFNAHGQKFALFIADRHAHLNGKGDYDTLRTNGWALVDAWRALGFNGDIFWSGEVNGDPYHHLLEQVMMETSVARLLRATPALGREETDGLPAAALLYAARQVADILYLNFDASMGIDQRKVNVLARELAETLGKPKPTLYFHRLIPHLRDPTKKMSKSDPHSGIYWGDTHLEIGRKVDKAFCAPDDLGAIGIIIEDIVKPWTGIDPGELTPRDAKDVVKKFLWQHMPDGGK